MESKNLVQKLRKNGIKVGVMHYRWVVSIISKHFGNDPVKFCFLAHVTQLNRKEFYLIKSNGGKTIVRLTFADGKDYSAESICSKEDTFCKRTGIYVAVQRILEQRKKDKYLKDHLHEGSLC